ELSLGPKRFTDLKAGLVGASPNVLSQRLHELEASGVVQRRSAGGARYELSEWGQQLRPLLLQLGLWGARSPVPRGAELGVDALMLALEATFVPAKAADLDARYELRFGEERFAVTVEHETILITRGSSRDPHAVIETDPSSLRGLVFGDLKLANADAVISGNARLGRAFLRLFARP
ncbi:MAG TPA: winged helix-turn-helix transcriptional regulator, partial [Polyangiales bacterium]|nr:winged helix-turn-helix transcriptional regulator [Polyangiales bacterium]